MRKPALTDRLSFIEFQSPTLVEQPPEGDDWIHEIKHDGYRTQLVIERGQARAFTRKGFDWSTRYQPIVTAAAELPVKSAILDGEMIVMNEAGISDFHNLRSAMRWQPDRLAFVAFDLLHLDGADLRRRPLMERRTALAGSSSLAAAQSNSARTFLVRERHSFGKSIGSAWRAWCRSGLTASTAAARQRHG